MKAVETNSPKISAQASPEKIGSSVIGMAASIAVPAVSRIGRVRTAPERIVALRRSWPSRSATCRNSISRIALRTAMPARAIMPIIAVAVKKVGSA